MLERARGAPRALPGGIANGALLVVDVQGDFADPANLTAMGVPLEAQGAVADAVDRMLGLIEAARTTGLEVVWIRGGGAIDSRWESVLWLIGQEEEGTGFCVPGTPGFEFWKVAPREGEPIVTKSRYSGFVRTDLEQLLLDRGITWVAVCGLTSACCVSSTAWDAMQRDFKVVVVGDATTEYDLDAHAASLESMAENIGVVVSARELERVLTVAFESEMAAKHSGRTA
jgi:ureidoacrylate peracid hydrolase